MITKVSDLVSERMKEQPAVGQEIFKVYKYHTVDVVAKYLKKHHIGAVGVFDNQEQLLGTYSHSNGNDNVLAEDRIPARTPVVEVMSKEIVVVLARATIEECERLMKLYNILHLAVVRDSVSEMFIDGRETRNHSTYQALEASPKRTITSKHYLGLISERDLRKVREERYKRGWEEAKETTAHLEKYLFS